MRRHVANWLAQYARRLALRLEQWAQPTWRIAPNGRFFHCGRYLNRDGHMARWSEVVTRDPCPYCGKPSTTEEHVIPRSKGGSSGATNIVGACRSCNHAKGDQPLLQFLLVRRRQRFTRHVVSARAKRNQARRVAKHGQSLSATLAEHSVLTQMRGHA